MSASQEAYSLEGSVPWYHPQIASGEGPCGGEREERA